MHGEKCHDNVIWAHNENKEIIILDGAQTQWLVHNTLTAEPKYRINVRKTTKIFAFKSKVYTIMERTVSYFSILQKYINSKQKSLKRLYTVFK